MSDFQVPDAVSLEDLREAMEAAAPQEEEFVKATTPDEILEDARASDQTLICEPVSESCCFMNMEITIFWHVVAFQHGRLIRHLY